MTFTRVRPVAVWVLAWLVLASVYAVLLYTQSLGAMPGWLSARVALTTTLVPAATGAGVWRLSGTYRWPERAVRSFFGVHVLLAIGFSAAWSAWVVVLARAGSGARMPMDVLMRGVVPAQLVIGLLLYGFIAASSYAARGALQSRELRIAAEHAERSRAEAELSALRAHIDPHFLFNTLHSVGELLAREPAVARDALARLADLFRYALRLDRERRDMVLLDDEWRVVESYLYLEQLRLGTRLSVTASLDDDALACAVPSFTLQPLIENAIRHGLSPKPEGGELSVRAFEEDGTLTIEVRDTGVGGSLPDFETSTGFGIRSIRMRLAARYGSRATLDLAVSGSAGVTATVTLPAENLA